MRTLIMLNRQDEVKLWSVADTPLCVNPAHLTTGTHRENSLDKIAKGRAKKTYSHIRDAERAEILKLWKSGWTQLKLVKKFQREPKTIRRVCRQHLTDKHIALNDPETPDRSK